MNRTEHLLSILSEECHEIGQRAMKASRFGLTEIQPEQEFNNAERIVHEFADLLAVIYMLNREGNLPIDEDELQRRIDAKKAKVEQYLEYSKTQGTLS